MIAASVFAACVAVAVVFQWALVAGAPWAHLTMGGRYASATNRLPVGARIACLLQSGVLIAMAVWLSRFSAGSLPTGWSANLVWLIVGISALSFVANTITPSAAERKLWMPVTFAMLVSSVIVGVKGG